MTERSDATHPATAARLDRACRDGDVAKSRELSIAIQFLFGVCAVYFASTAAAVQVGNFTSESWSRLATPEEASALLLSLIWTVAVTVLPVLAILFVSGIASHWIQTGIRLNTRQLSDGISSMSPTNWWRRTFSAANLIRGFLGAPKALVVFSVAILVLWLNRETLTGIGFDETRSVIAAGAQLVFQTTFWIAMALLVVSGFDFLMEWITHRARIRMTDQEIRDEQRLQGIDPQVSAQRRRVARETLFKNSPE